MEDHERIEQALIELSKLYIRIMAWPFDSEQNKQGVLESVAKATGELSQLKAIYQRSKS